MAPRSSVSPSSGHHQPRVEEQLHPQPVAGRAGAEGCVEREQPRLDLGNGEAALGAGELLGEGDPPRLLALGGRRLQDGDAVREVERGPERVRQPRLQPFAHDDAVHDHVDVVAELLVERRRALQVVELPVDLDALEALLAQVRELLAVLALAVAHDRREQIGARPLRQRLVMSTIWLTCCASMGRPVAGL
jgi:hypothetical protein